MSRIEAPRVGRHPGKMPGGVKLADCMQELMSVFGQMIVSTADRESRAFLGMSGIAASMDFYDPNAREPYVTSWYLRDAASEAMVKALSSGHLPTGAVAFEKFIIGRVSGRGVDHPESTSGERADSGLKIFFLRSPEPHPARLSCIAARLTMSFNVIYV